MRVHIRFQLMKRKGWEVLFGEEAEDGVERLREV
jgi:hypothetical protein